MNTPIVRQRVRTAIKQKRIIVVKYIREDEVLPVETRLIPLDIISEIRGIARQQSFLIGFEVDYIPGILEEKDFRRFMIETISEVRITVREFDPQKPVALYRKMKRTPTVAWNIQRDW